MAGPRILACFTQMGGANALLPFLRTVAGGAMTVTGRAPVCRMLEAQGVDTVSLDRLGWAPGCRTGGDWPRSIEADVVVTDTLNMARDPLEGTAVRNVWRAARRHGVPSVAYVDSWWAYDGRFRLAGETEPPVLPDTIAAVDGRVRDELLALGYPGGRVEMLGSPRFERLRRSGVRNGAAPNGGMDAREDFRILFVSQPFEAAIGSVDEWGFTERSTLTAVLAVLGALPEAVRARVELVVALHPEESAEEMARFLETAPRGLRVCTIRGEEVLPALEEASLVLGMFSILLAEAVILRRPVLSVQIDLKREDMLVTNLVGATVPVRSFPELARRLPAAIQEPAERRAMLDRQERFEIIEDAQARWLDWLSRAASRRREASSGKTVQ